MHRVVQEHIERVLAGANAQEAVTHLEHCEGCRQELAGMQEHAALLQQLRFPAGSELEPRAGFYARVLERIESEGPVSIWNLFMESAFGRRIAVASLALAVLLGVYLISSERTAEEPIIAGQSTGQFDGQPALSLMAAREDGAGQIVVEQGSVQQVISLSYDDPQLDPFSTSQFPNEQVAMEPSTDDAILSNLVTYHEQ